MLKGTLSHKPLLNHSSPPSSRGLIHSPPEATASVRNHASNQGRTPLTAFVGSGEHSQADSAGPRRHKSAWKALDSRSPIVVNTYFFTFVRDPKFFFIFSLTNIYRCNSLYRIYKCNCTRMMYEEDTSNIRCGVAGDAGLVVVAGLNSR